MEQFIKQLQSVWFIILAIASLIVWYGTINSRVQALETSDAKQEIRIERNDATLQKIQIDVSYIRAKLEAKF
jgi:hypothetical protein